LGSSAVPTKTSWSGPSNATAPGVVPTGTVATGAQLVDDAEHREVSTTAMVPSLGTLAYSVCVSLSIANPTMGTGWSRSKVPSRIAGWSHEQEANTGARHRGPPATYT